jgi:hypothetical protein
MAYTPSRTSDDWRAEAAHHDRKADSHASGELKDSHIIAAKACRNAADCIDRANRAGVKAAIFESAIVHGDSAPRAVEVLEVMGFSKAEIEQLTERDPAMSSHKFFEG